MKRLGYIKLFHQQAVSQSFAPLPLNFSAISMFYDVMEHFFILAMGHYCEQDNLDLSRPFSHNLKNYIAPDGTKLSNRESERRTGTVRHSFKHDGGVPNSDQIEQARRDTAAFLESNCHRVFGVQYADISMLHIVPQDAVRAHLQSGRTAADQGDLKAGMGELALAFDLLMIEWGRGKYLTGDSFTTARFGLVREYARDRRIEVYGAEQGARGAVAGMVSALKKELGEVDKQLEAMRQVLRLQIAGIDLSAHVRFAMLAPDVVLYVGGKRSVSHKEGQFHYTPENYDFCESFVVDSALRIGRSDFTLWMPQTFGDYDRARAAMEINGGRLPDDMKP